MGVVGTKDLLSPRKRSMTVAEVARLPIACYNEPILDAILAEMFAAHPFQNVIMHASNIPLIDEYVQGGRAVTFSDSFSDFLNPNPSGLLFIPIERSVTFSVGFVHSRRAGWKTARPGTSSGSGAASKRRARRTSRSIRWTARRRAKAMPTGEGAGVRAGTARAGTWPHAGGKRCGQGARLPSVCQARSRTGRRGDYYSDVISMTAVSIA